MGLEGERGNGEDGRKIFKMGDDRMMMGVDRKTPGYLLREELQTEKLRERAGKGAWRYEQKLRGGEGSELARLCLTEMEKRDREIRGVSGWKKERKMFFEERKLRREEVGVGGEGWFEREQEDKERQREERWRRIERSGYNRWYKVVKEEGVPSYLRKGWGKSRWRRVISFRLGNDIKEGKYWEREERCRMCEVEVETWEHLYGRGV